MKYIRDQQEQDQDDLRAGKPIVVPVVP